jgi:hypothetical protein
VTGECPEAPLIKGGTLQERAKPGQVAEGRGMVAGPWRVAQIVVDRGRGVQGVRGSGYLVAPGRKCQAG